VTRNLLIVSALLELGIGILLIASPSPPIALLLGAQIETPVGLSVAHVAGAALLSLGIACWMARNDGQSAAGRAVVTAMLVYDCAASAALAYSSLRLSTAGVGLWPAVGLHLAMAVWCVACLRRVSGSSGG